MRAAGRLDVLGPVAASRARARPGLVRPVLHGARLTGLLSGLSGLPGPRLLGAISPSGSLPGPFGRLCVFFLGLRALLGLALALLSLRALLGLAIALLGLSALFGLFV